MRESLRVDGKSQFAVRDSWGKLIGYADDNPTERPFLEIPVLLNPIPVQECPLLFPVEISEFRGILVKATRCRSGETCWVVDIDDARLLARSTWLKPFKQVPA